MCRPAGPGRDAWTIFRPLNRIAAQPARVDKADGSDSGRVMAALSDAAVIDVTAADQSRVKAGCRTRGNHVKMPWQRAACSGLKCASLCGWLAVGIHLPVRSRTVCWNQRMRPGPQVPGIRFGDWLVRRAIRAGWEIGAPMSGLFVSPGISRTKIT
jgi:hypothetical protein